MSRKRKIYSAEFDTKIILEFIAAVIETKKLLKAICEDRLF